MVKSNLILTILLSFILINNNFATAPTKDLSKITQENKNAIYLLKLWHSIDDDGDNIKDPYPILKWEQLLTFEYDNALKRNETALALKLSIPLSFTYHAETKFSKGMPILEALLGK